MFIDRSPRKQARKRDRRNQHVKSESFAKDSSTIGQDSCPYFKGTLEIDSFVVYFLCKNSPFFFSSTQKEAAEKIFSDKDLEQLAKLMKLSPEQLEMTLQVNWCLHFFFLRIIHTHLSHTYTLSRLVRISFKKLLISS